MRLGLGTVGVEIKVQYYTLILAKRPRNEEYKWLLFKTRTEQDTKIVNKQNDQHQDKP